MRRIIAPLGLGTVAAFCLACPVGAAEPAPAAPTDTVRRTADQAEQERQRQGAQDPAEKDWSVGLFTGVQYDDNIILRSQDVHTGGDRTDWKSVHALFADYRFVNSDERVLGLRYNGYQTIIDKHDEVQLTGNGLTLHHTEIHAPFVLDLPVSGTHYDLKDEKYLNLWSAAPALYLQESDHLVGVLRGGFRRFAYYDVPGSDFNEPDRNSRVYEAGLEQWLLLGERAQWRLEAGWSWRHEVAHENEWSNDAREARAGARGTLPWWSLGLEAAATFTDKDYRERNDLFEKTQRDEITGAGLTISKPVTNWALVSVSYLYTHQHSNVESQDYQRNQATLGLTVLF